MSKSTLKKDYFWNTIGVFLQNATSPLLLVAITRINGIDTSGLFSFAFAVSIVLFAFGLWGGRTYQVSDIKREFDHRSYIFARIILGIAMVAAVTLFAFANNYDVYKSAILIVLVVYKAIESIADAIYGILQAHSGLSYVGKSLLYKTTLGLILFIFVDVLTGDIIMSSIAIVLVNVVFVMLYDIRLARKFEEIGIKSNLISFYVHEAGVILKRTVTIFAVTFLATFSINIPRFFIDKYDASQIGYFGVLAMPITLIALFMSFILQPNMVQLTKMYNREKYQEFKKVINRVMMVTLIFGVVVAVGTFIVGIPLLSVIFGVDFSGHKTELMIMIIGGIANAFVAIFIVLLTIMRRFKALFYNLLFTNLALVIASTILVQEYGMLAGVSLFALANIVQTVILEGVYYSILRRKSS
jgi:O-antigen/teichoic acid export membrane protein